MSIAKILDASLPRRLRGVLIVTGIQILSALAVGADVQLQLLSSGAMPKMGGYTPQRLALSTTRPNAVKSLPPGLTAPLFGTLKLGAQDSAAAIVVVLDEPDGSPSRLFVDTNGNGELADDPTPEWTSRPVKGKDGADYTQFSGAANVQLRFAGELATVSIAMYRFDRRDPARAAYKDTLFYYADYAREGETAFGETVYKVMLADRNTTADFRGKKTTPSGINLFIDVNSNGKFDGLAESFDVRQPFNVGGQTYEIAGLTPGGESFRIEKSSKVVAARKVPERPSTDALLGKPALPFKAKTTDGTSIDFPSSFKGKLVLLDFWAMWCGPCIGELPHLTAVYQKYNAAGFEVLGISLDRAGEDKKLAAFTQQNRMPWRQIFDGGYWQAKVATLYGVRSIPAAYLVDGDTGLVIATSGLRGSELETTVAAAFAKKYPK
jgi:thiol-disulfide isomerase/thioredoxin